MLTELIEWWQDLCELRIGSRAVLMALPPEWGRSSVLRRFRRAVKDPDGPVTLVLDICPIPPVSQTVQAQALHDALMPAAFRSRAVQLLGLDTAAGDIQAGLGIGSLFVSGLAAAVPILLASFAMTVAGSVWDTSPAGPQGPVARSARAVAKVSVSVPVVVIVDDAERVDADLVITMIENLIGRHDGQVLVPLQNSPQVL